MDLQRGLRRFVASVLLPVVIAAISACAPAPLGSGHRQPETGSPGLQTASPAAADSRFTLIAFNDFHGHLLPSQRGEAAGNIVPGAVEIGGAAALAARLTAEREAQPSQAIISTGDLIGASPLVSALFLDEPTIRVMNQIGLSANVLGNHEFDRGYAELRRIIDGGCARTQALDSGRRPCLAEPYRGAAFPFIAANVFSSGSDLGSSEPLFAPAWTTEKGAFKLAVVGAVLRGTPSIVNREGIRGLRFTDEADAINRSVEALAAKGVTHFVAAIHQGLRVSNPAGPNRDLNACQNPQGDLMPILRKLDSRINVVLSAHTHQAYRCEINGRIVLSALAFGLAYSKIEFLVDQRSGSAKLLEARNHPVLMRQHERDHPTVAAVAQIVEAYRAEAEPIAARPVGELASPLLRQQDESGMSPLGAVIADAHLEATRSAGAQLAMTNLGGIRSEFPQAGEVSYGALFASQPFGNLLITLTISGADLIELFERALAAWGQEPGRSTPRFLQVSEGMEVSWGVFQAGGRRSVAIKLNGEAIDPQRDYRVTVNDFLAQGGDGHSVFRRARDRSASMLDLDAFEAYFKDRRMLRAPDPGRFKRVRAEP